MESSFNSPVNQHNPSDKLVSMAQKPRSYHVTVSSFSFRGVHVIYEDVKGFIPSSHLVNPPNHLGELIGKTIEVMPIAIGTDNKSLILSEKMSLQGKHFSSLKEGDLVSGQVAKIEAYGIFIDLGKGVWGLLHNTSMPISSDVNRENLKLGDNISVRIVSKDNSRKRISLAFNNQPAEKPEQVMSEGLLGVGDQFFLDKKCFSLVKRLSSGIQLSDPEFAILRCLSQHLGETVPYEHILHELDNSESDIQIIYSCVHRLNLIFSNNDINISIENERGKGYRLEI